MIEPIVGHQPPRGQARGDGGRRCRHPCRHTLSGHQELGPAATGYPGRRSCC